MNIRIMRSTGIKSIICILLSIIMAAALFACGDTADPPEPGGPPPAVVPTDPADPVDPGEDKDKPVEPGDPAPADMGPAEDILGDLTEALGNMDVEMPMALPPTPVGSDMSEFILGLSESDYDKYVDSAAHSTAAIGTFAHQIIIINAKDNASAQEIKKLVSGSGGYDAQKWVCVWPERCIAVDAGVHVLLVAARNPVVDAALDIFKDMMSGFNIGEVVTFFEHEGGGEEGGAGAFPGGGLLLP